MIIGPSNYVNILNSYKGDLKTNDLFLRLDIIICQTFINKME